MNKGLFSLFFFTLIALVGPGLAFAEDAGLSGQYVVYPSDILEISVYGETEMTRELVVRPDGRVSYPLAGDIKVAGHTTSEIKSTVDQALSKFIPEANSTVIVKDLGSLKYFVVGEVAKPGMFNVSNQLTVLQALALAGGLTTFASQGDIKIIRGHGKDTKNIPFDYGDVKKGNNLGQNILLERGDVIIVP
jgi:polysaccharide export outer membrane protein